MPLTFPNRSRSYDEHGHRVRFVGYDGMMEVPFFVEETALSSSGAVEARSEIGLLKAFDAARDTVLKVAAKAYARGRKKMYVLTDRDFA
ncbi:DUF1488 domain-containing protein [Aurantimonas sp. VKM B-3413]|uniref:DUF1488 domain-containing protein n=1 Tax=Aurantimonas sp. VKM B-3413 TaxID=2779401 RepID=UPI001E284B30|nr:DUF1488 domain-containing protein [Aurantimonas sp. VKM B-3413]MCB8840523.1 DUF1488 domain-containing protein [Aurantimonas sp. VKM B-3413]